MEKIQSSDNTEVAMLQKSIMELESLKYSHDGKAEEEDEIDLRLTGFYIKLSRLINLKLGV